MKFTFPYEFTLREYQKPLWRHIQNGGKRAIAVWHRRAGKDLTLWNLMICEAWKRVGLYYYFLPTYTQGKKIIWDGITIDGRKFINYIPDDCIDSKNGQEMKIALKNGSIIQVIGTDNYDTIRGTNPVGCVFSEFAFQNPAVWDVVKPILKVNKGWAVFNSTPNGKNDFYDLNEMAIENKDWFAEKLTITDTNVLTEKDMEEEREEGMTEEMLQQEYYCSFDIGALGSYYADYVRQAREEGRVCGVPCYPNIPVDVFFDLGRNDSTTMIFTQTVGKEIHIIDSYEHSGVGVDHYIQVLKDYGYNYNRLFLPHDAEHVRLESNRSIEQQFKEGGFKTHITENIPIGVGELNGIQQVRKIFPRLWFDKEKNFQLIRALENYHKEWDEKAKVFRNQPKHDWSSHFADTLRYLAVNFKEKRPKRDKAQEVFDRFSAV
jgi:hypothetical protein